MRLLRGPGGFCNPGTSNPYINQGVKLTCSGSRNFRVDFIHQRTAVGLRAQSKPPRWMKTLISNVTSLATETYCQRYCSFHSTILAAADRNSFHARLRCFPDNSFRHFPCSVPFLQFICCFQFQTFLQLSSHPCHRAPNSRL